MGCKNFKLELGNFMPMIGFGTFRIHGNKLIKEVLDIALAAGYRSIDTAAVYGNEKDVGDALKILLPKYNLKREDIFITTKLPPSHHAGRAISALTNSLKNLDCGYLDLYLIHWPGQSGTSVTSANNSEVRTQTWQQLVEAKKQGLVRDIGVSNYTVKHLEELISNCFGEKPAVNQVLLRWALQQDIAIIPKGTSRNHIEANIDLDFEIPDKDISLLNSLKKTRKYAWNPEEVL